MIGNDFYHFQGIFRGNGHSIYADINYPNSQYVGLFNRIDGGGVFSITIVGNVRGGNTVGGVIGRVDLGIIVYCINIANIYGGDTIGGIVGAVFGGGDFSSLKNSGTIQSFYEQIEPGGKPDSRRSIIGGIAGYIEEVNS